MKRLGILNSDIACVLANLGHTDRIAIGDCGLPIPDDVIKIDLALKLGSPKFIEVLEEVLKDMKVEKIILAKEIKKNNPKVFEEIGLLVNKNDIDKIDYVTHEEFKEKLYDVKAIIRTGEASPYANIILQSNVIF
jgi:D-ribose pyranase